jgi:ADP-ribosylation factor-like protein 2
LRLAGATLLVFANKQDLPGSMTADEIKEVFTIIHLVKSKHFVK